CLGATYHLVGGKGRERRGAARGFYKRAYAPAVQPGGSLTPLPLSVPPQGHGFAYQKLKRKGGGYATAAAAGGPSERRGAGGTAGGDRDEERGPGWNLLDRPDQRRRHAAMGGGSRARTHGVSARRGEREESSRLGRSDYVAGFGCPRTRALSHQDGGRHVRT